MAKVITMGECQDLPRHGRLRAEAVFTQDQQAAVLLLFGGPLLAAAKGHRDPGDFFGAPVGEDSLGRFRMGGLRGSAGIRQGQDHSQRRQEKVAAGQQRRAQAGPASAVFFFYLLHASASLPDRKATPRRRGELACAGCPGCRCPRFFTRYVKQAGALPLLLPSPGISRRGHGIRSS